MDIGYDIVFQYLLLKEYPPDVSENRQRAIRRRANKFVLKDGILHYSSKETLKPWITDEKKQQNIIQACHADKLGGHFGRDKTREKVTSRYINLYL